MPRKQREEVIRVLTYTNRQPVNNNPKAITYITVRKKSSNTKHLIKKFKRKLIPFDYVDDS